MWLTNSSIGRKVVMSVTGVCFFLFLLFHGAMNLVAVFSAEGYNEIAHFLGTNPVVQFMVPILMAIILIHIIYSIMLWSQNRKARGNDRYEVTGKAKIDWASKNMLLIGLIILGGLVLHLINFWAKMQLQAWMGNASVLASTQMEYIFSKPWIVIIYLLWFCAIWFHLSHGIWSAAQTVGLNNKKWINIWKTIGYVFATLILIMFAFVAIAFYLKSVGVWPEVGNIWHLGAAGEIPASQYYGF